MVDESSSDQESETKNNPPPPQVELDVEEMRAVVNAAQAKAEGDEVDPDSLAEEEDDGGGAKKDADKDDEDREVADVFANDQEEVADDNSIGPRQQACPSRSSMVSQRSITFFVDFDQAPATATPPVIKRNSIRSQSAKTPSSQRMTQSMYAKRPPDDRRTSSDSVSFFVEFPNTPAAVGACGSAGNSSNQTRMIKSMSREEPPCQELSSMSDEMQEKSRVLMLKNLEHTKKFFNKLKGCIDFLQAPSYSKDELRLKRCLAENITMLMFEEEQRLGQGKDLVGADKLDQLVKTIPSRPTSSQTSARPRSAAVVMSSDTKSNNFLGVGDNDDRPAVLRREKTFDLSDNSNNQQQQQKSKGTHHHNTSKLIDIQLDTESHSSHKAASSSGSTRLRLQQPVLQINETSRAEKPGTRQKAKRLSDELTSPIAALDCPPDLMASLQLFQQQRLFHTRRLRREMKKLEAMEREIAIRTAQISVPPPEPKPRQCWTAEAASAKPASKIPVPQQVTSPQDNGYASRPPKRTPRRRDSQHSTNSSCNNSLIQSPPPPQQPQVISPSSDVAVVSSPPPPPVTTSSVQTTTLAAAFKSHHVKLTPSSGSNHHHHQRLPSKVKINMVRSMNGSMTDSTGSMGSSVSSACSWFIPNSDEILQADSSCTKPESDGGDQSHNKSIQTGGSLLKQFRERKDKACMTRDRPQAYFLACDEDVPSAPSPDKRLTDPYVEVKANGSSTIVRRRVTAQRPTVSDLSRSGADPQQTKIIDLETESLPLEQNLQEALRRKRPDYIQRTKTREQDRMARSFVAANKSSLKEAVKVYGSNCKNTSGGAGGKNGSRIPRSSSTLQETRAYLNNQTSSNRLMPNTAIIYSKNIEKNNELNNSGQMKLSKGALRTNSSSSSSNSNKRPSSGGKSIKGSSSSTGVCSMKDNNNSTTTNGRLMHQKQNNAKDISQQQQQRSRQQQAKKMQPFANKTKQ